MAKCPVYGCTREGYSQTTASDRLCEEHLPGFHAAPEFRAAISATYWPARAMWTAVADFCRRLAAEGRP